MVARLTCQILYLLMKELWKIGKTMLVENNFSAKFFPGKKYLSL